MFSSQHFTADMAQGFHTGTAAGGYKLTSVQLPFLDSVQGTPPVYSVGIYTEAGNTPDTLVGTLTAPASIVQGTNTFRAVGGIDLDADTSYFVVIDVTENSSRYKWVGYTLSFAEVAGDAGWSIWDDAHDNGSGTWARTIVAGQKWIARLAIHGYLKNAYPPDAPGAPTLAADTAKGGRLRVSWDEPSETNGAAVLDYDLRYYKGSADPTDEADWIAEGDPRTNGIPDPGATTGDDVGVWMTGLAPASAYRVQVRAENAAGEGPWSASASGTTPAASTSNNAPRLPESKTGDSNNSCQVKTDTSTPSATINASAGTLVSISPIRNRQTETTEWPDSCTGTDRDDPVFDDRDADTLTYGLSYTLPDNVVALSDPSISESTAKARLWFTGAAAGTETNLRVDVTATDPHGASASTHVIFRVGTFPNSAGAPSLPAPGLLRFAQNKRGSAVLPAATTPRASTTSATSTM